MHRLTGKKHSKGRADQPLAPPPMLYLALGALSYTTRSRTALLQTDTTFDASKCTALSGKDIDTAWCVASCGAIANPSCPESFCKCEGEMPATMDAGLTAQQEQAAAKDSILNSMAIR